MRLPFYTVTQSVSQSNSPQHSSPAFFSILGMFLLPTPLRSFCQSRYSSDCPSFVQYSIFLEGSIHKLTHPSHSFTHSYIYTSLFNSKHLLQKHRPSRGTISLRELFSLNPPDIFPHIYICIYPSQLLSLIIQHSIQPRRNYITLLYLITNPHVTLRKEVFFFTSIKSLSASFFFAWFLFTFTTLMAFFAQPFPSILRMNWTASPIRSCQLLLLDFQRPRPLQLYQRSYERDNLPFQLLPTSSSQSSTTATLSAISSYESSTTATLSAHQGF